MSDRAADLPVRRLTILTGKWASGTVIAVMRYLARSLISAITAWKPAT
jgi:hypothetical protein